MARFIRFLCMFLMGGVLAYLKIQVWNWGFWALFILVMIHAIICNAEGYKEASGEWPWEDDK